MTQSGQGEEPSARPAREGIVLPSDGGEPLLPGMTGGPGDAQGRRPVPPPAGGPQASAPAEGQTWGQPWGPDRQQTPPPPPGQTWQSQPQQWSTQEPPAWDAQAPGALPPEGAQPPNPYAGPPADPGPYGTAQPPAGHTGYDPYGTAGAGAPRPPEGSGAQPQPGQGAQPQDGSGYGYPQGAGLPAAGAYGTSAGSGAQPQGPDAYGTSAGSGAQPQQGSGGQGQPGQGAQPQDGSGYGYPQGAGLPSAADAYGTPGGGARPQPGAEAYGGGLPPGSGAYGSADGGAPGPAPADEGATQYIPPVVGDAAAAATQYLPPVAPSGDEGATQYIPPVGPGALPPEMPSGGDPEATRFLGTGPRTGAGAGPLPAASHPDAEATQYIPPVPGGDKQPPAEFDNLFRSQGGAESPAGATQQMPRIEQPGPQPSYAAPGASQEPPAGGRSRGGRAGSRVPVIAAVGIGIAVLGVGAGALLAGGGGGDDDGGDNKPVAASAPAADGSASPSADPARAQAVELDKLLADSGNSRSTVINAVADVKGCDNLSEAAKDLRDAAKQRTGLVTRLSGIEVDELPGHAALTTALTKAWQASASADNHYAAWADQTAGKKGCRKGQARPTGQTQAGNRASGVATAEKAKAAGLWNGIAKKYGLPERQPTQL
ncbi:hypothetical protein [Streptomyces cahuitamycinicus]|uniref:Uncharacterized protein n=1 Tax=Streptomyces cahuitamycinicus TaxID=2070367 RepID=A0A2N8TH28_9ACTN|nr:hypothetical protein [Streptomyces cahuitamycinicus]PNG18318.1 hypothetical protein C1J00_31750 [Streptomyces cahuitamycinicus]